MNYAARRNQEFYDRPTQPARVDLFWDNVNVDVSRVDAIVGVTPTTLRAKIDFGRPRKDVDRADIPIEMLGTSVTPRQYLNTFPRVITNFSWLLTGMAIFSTGCALYMSSKDATVRWDVISASLAFAAIAVGMRLINRKVERVLNSDLTEQDKAQIKMMLREIRKYR
ncbi:hypothetical protein JI749_12330 [Devosia oryziradicis]|uniref:Uncharacterized protein n=1 Tax=Devosia oryziradicis TaxID=2801335 RepID=A0ABX7BZC6_9HYPH|nr:hypothetical protein [Devosia oryziradicis]QQR35156.1 hypothetical protein JI749_12330 [Devosia oryziradicis]